MKKAIVLGAAAALACAGAAPAHAQRDIFGIPGSTAAEMRRLFMLEARDQVTAVLVRYTTAWGNRDVDALTALYDRDAVLYPAGSGMVVGRTAIQEYFRGLLPTVRPMDQRIIEFRASGDMAYVTAQVRYAVDTPTATRDVTDTDVIALHRDPLGEWTIVSHLARVEQATAVSTRRPAG